jgi:phosphatidylinositol glycan class V
MLTRCVCKAVHILGNAEFGYETEKNYAFFPGLPLVLRFLATIVQFGALSQWEVRSLRPPAGANAVGVQICFRSCLVLTGFLFCNACFVFAANALHRYAQALHCCPSHFCRANRRISLAVLRSARLARLSALLFCCTPSSVFMSAVYTESPFALCSFLGLALLAERCRWCVCHSAVSCCARLSACSA